MSLNFRYIFLIGDFNSRTSDDDDFSLVDESDQNIGYGNLIFNKVEILDDLNILRKRKSSDKSKHGYGKKTTGPL